MTKSLNKLGIEGPQQGAREMAQRLGALANGLPDQGSIPSVHMLTTVCSSSSRRSDTLLADIHAEENTNVYKMKKFI